MTARHLGRRALLRWLAAPGAVACAACRGDSRPAPPASSAPPPAGTRAGAPAATAPRPSWPRTSFPASTFPEGARTIVRVGGFPVEVRREGDSLTARSLLCPHMGCTVAWREESRRYRCPCHEGLFDADGHALQGPPPRDLDRVPLAVSGATVTVG